MFSTLLSHFYLRLVHPPEIRGLAISTIMIGTGLLASPATYIVGAVHDVYDNVQLEVILGFGIPTLLASLLFFLAARNQRNHFLQLVTSSTS